MTENLIKHMHCSCCQGPNMNNAWGATVKYKIFNLSNLTCMSSGKKRGAIYIFFNMYRIIKKIGELKMCI